MSEVPENLDWIAEKFHCSVSEVFTSFTDLARADVAARAAQLTAAERRVRLEPRFTQDDGPNYFSVASGEKRARFFLGEGVIEITGYTVLHEDFALSVTTTLTANGQCRLQINGAGEFTKWQVMRRAIEGILFQAAPPVI